MKDMVYSYEYNGGDLCYPGTNVLRNKLDIRDLEELLRVEKEMSMVRYFDLSTQGVTGDFSMGHLCAIHRYLFQDIYEWAGELRRERLHLRPCHYNQHCLCRHLRHPCPGRVCSG